MHWFAPPLLGKRLKGNQGEILDSPAAVSFVQRCRQLLYATGIFFREGACNRNKSEDLPCILYHCFRGKSVESNEPDKPSIISFIKPNSEKVKKVINSAKFI